MRKYWKTLIGSCIHQSSNGIEVHQNYLYRWLTFGKNDLQTLIHRHHLSTPGLPYLTPLTLAARVHPADCCLLGLGGAGVAHALAPWLSDSMMHAVENNLDIIHVAYTFFMTNQLQGVIKEKDLQQIKSKYY